MKRIFILIISTVAVWRLCNLLQYEEGPFEIFTKFRDRIGLTKVSDLPLNEQLLYSDKEFIHDGNFFAKLVECIWCLSIWISFCISIYLAIFKIIEKSLAPIYTLTMSAFTILIVNRRFFNG